MAQLQAIDEVRHTILARLAALDSERVTIDRAGGRVLAESIVSRDPIPPFDNTSMDGFALRSDDVRHASRDEPVRLQVVTTVAAGSVELVAIDRGQAARIYTGAPIPPGADCVVPWESTAHHDDDSVTLIEPPQSGACVRRRGEDIDVGDVALEPGRRLTPAAIGLLATLGFAVVRAYRCPRVAIHSTGDEIIPIRAALSPGKIRNSNAPSLAARVEQAGAQPLVRPVLRDTMDAVRSGLRRTLSLRPDVILTTGGVSAGDLDFVREVAKEIGEDVAVRKIDMKPGKPLVDGSIAGVPFFGLPGNPAACLVSFEVFVRPALERLSGIEHPVDPRRRARLIGDTRPRTNRRIQYLRAHCRYDASAPGYVVELLDRQGSHQMSSFAMANCLLVVPAGAERQDDFDIWLL